MNHYTSSMKSARWKTENRGKLRTWVIVQGALSPEPSSDDPNPTRCLPNHANWRESMSASMVTLRSLSKCHSGQTPLLHF